MMGVLGAGCEAPHVVFWFFLRLGPSLSVEVDVFRIVAYT